MRGGDDGPALGGQGVEEGAGPRQQVHPAARHVLDLQVLDPRDGLRHDVGGQQVGGYLGGRPAVQLDPGELLGGDPVLRGPPRPAAVHRGEGGDEGSVVVEQQGLRVDLHVLDPTVPARGGSIGPFRP